MRGSKTCDDIPDLRDGLTRAERTVLRVLAETQRELGDRAVPTAMLYGRVVEHMALSVEAFLRVLRRLQGRHREPADAQT
jgi:hypothetical protein